ncbi:hypothetical protein ES708_34448 [subsurface metagenome]
MPTVSFADIETPYQVTEDREGTPFIERSHLNLNNLIQEEYDFSDEHWHTPVQSSESGISFARRTGEWLHYEVYLPFGTAYHLEHLTPTVIVVSLSEIYDPPIKEIGPVEDIVSNILSFHTLKQDWDGYGAIPSNVKTCANSISFLVEVKEFKVYITEVYPDPHGTISIEWENLNNERLVVEIGEDGFSFYIKYDAKPLITGEFDTSDIAAEKISQHLKKLFP